MSVYLLGLVVCFFVAFWSINLSAAEAEVEDAVVGFEDGVVS